MRIAELKRLGNSVFCFSPFAISFQFRNPNSELRIPDWWLPKIRAGTGACPYKDFSIPNS